MMFDQKKEFLGMVQGRVTPVGGADCYPKQGVSEPCQFLEPWAQQAKAGGILAASVIRAALAQHLGWSIKPSVVYRLLERHGWRKVSPGIHHPNPSSHLPVGAARAVCHLSLPSL